MFPDNDAESGCYQPRSRQVGPKQMPRHPRRHQACYIVGEDKVFGAKDGHGRCEKDATKNDRPVEAMAPSRLGPKQETQSQEEQ
jgi:hypothetical protein